MHRKSCVRSTGVAIGLTLAIVCSDARDLHAQTSQSSPIAPSQTDAGQEPPAITWTGGRYRLTPSDVLDVKFPYVSEFDQTVTLQPDGYVSLRAVGDVRIQGRTVPEAQALIAEKYAGILNDPVVNIVVKEFEKPYFMVSGEVARPGKYELRGATTLTQALEIAGGQHWSAKHSQVVLFRRFTEELLEVKEFDVKKMYASRDLSEDPLLRPGDTVLVPKSFLAKLAPYMPRPGIGLYLNPFTP